MAENRLGAPLKRKKTASKGKAAGDSDSEPESDAAAEEEDEQDETAEALEPHIRNLEISAAAAGDDADSSEYVLLRCAPHASKGVLKNKGIFHEPWLLLFFFFFATTEEN